MDGISVYIDTSIPRSVTKLHCVYAISWSQDIIAAYLATTGRPRFPHISIMCYALRQPLNIHV
jgi:hypothetical protein